MNTKNSLFVLLRGANTRTATEFNVRRRKRELTAGEFALLDLIRSSRHRVPTVSGLARDLGIDRNSVTLTLRGLEARGLVQRARKPGRRSQPLALTAKGSTARAGAALWFARTERSVRRGLGKVDADALVRILQKMLARDDP